VKSNDSLDDRRLAALLAASREKEPELPDPAILWRKARLLEALEARRQATRPVQVAHSISLALAAGVLAVLAGSEGVSLLDWMETVKSGLTLPLILSLFVLGAFLFLATGAAAGRNLTRRMGGNTTD
jgi:hypothetical protein